MSEHHSEETKKALQVRVRKIVGQLGAIEKMIDADKDCPDILNQLISARKAIKSLSEKLIDQHIHHCIDDAHKADGRKKLRELLAVLERYVD